MAATKDTLRCANEPTTLDARVPVAQEIGDQREKTEGKDEHVEAVVAEPRRIDYDQEYDSTDEDEDGDGEEEENQEDEYEKWTSMTKEERCRAIERDFARRHRDRRRHNMGKAREWWQLIAEELGSKESLENDMAVKTMVRRNLMLIQKRKFDCLDGSFERVWEKFFGPHHHDREDRRQERQFLLMFVLRRILAARRAVAETGEVHEWWAKDEETQTAVCTDAAL